MVWPLFNVNMTDAGSERRRTTALWIGPSSRSVSDGMRLNVNFAFRARSKRATNATHRRLYTATSRCKVTRRHRLHKTRASRGHEISMHDMAQSVETRACTAEPSVEIESVDRSCECDPSLRPVHLLLFIIHFGTFCSPHLKRLDCVQLKPANTPNQRHTNLPLQGSSTVRRRQQAENYRKTKMNR